MLIQAPSSGCIGAPFLDAQFVAQKNNFKLVKAGFQQQETTVQCSMTSQAGLWGINKAFMELVTKWVNNQDIPAVIGYPDPSIAWHEEIVHYTAPGPLGNVDLEMTLLFPKVNGPVPVVLYAHGDIEFNAPEIQYKQRYRDMIVALEFLHQGIAVAFPSRHGVGLSEGVYKLGYVSDADPAYIPRIHANDMYPALKYLQNRPEIDPHRVILVGQSAGGYSTMYMASQSPDGVIGAINFSGGRSDSYANESPHYLNRMLIDSFGELGKTTYIPSLWIYAENDSRFTPTTIQRSYEAFVAAGAKSRLLLLPPTPGDGHYVYHLPDLWRPALLQYLQEIGVAKATASEVAAQGNAPAQ
ncbi:dienelactone hydrolase [Herbaspirillum sp. Sphag1AN]|uniref:alpha/beta hydrolase family protein n=1 Tax=unclassified Herbaspirillum TaxID=2624150 RepID=UPI0016085FD1|nr:MULTISPECIES: alpha/beta hydrolase-fold protein [unclassified Herbaspirillum]MBB3211754.1 dienelactone hydrolase [Herbaspirillum sp. Sphag1AN]MBB3244978.1 dienelactone hydrolase [Herbaspirillum sp. Sphag64]